MTRKVPIVTGGIYHVFNRGVNKGGVFFTLEDYKRFLLTAVHYKTDQIKFSYRRFFVGNDPGSLEPAIQVLAYCLMPNHFHFLIRQLTDGGLTRFFQHLINSYVHYVNVKYQRVGPLFQGRFKNIPVESDEQLLHLSRYIHLNPLVSGVVNDLRNYRWSSYLSYVSDFEAGLCDKRVVLDYFKSKLDYERFVLDQVDYGKSLEQIKHLTFDSEG